MGRQPQLYNKPKAYKIRITPLGSEIPHDPYNYKNPTTAMLEFEKESLTCFVRSFEISKKEGKPHFHYYALSYNTKGTLDKRMNKLIGQGNGFHGSGEIVEDYPTLPMEYLSYLLKDCQDPLFFGFSPEEEESAWQVAKETAERVAKTKRPERGTTLQRLEENILNRLKEVNPNVEPSIPPDEQKLMRLLVLAYIDLNMLPQPSLLRAYCRTLLLKHHQNLYLTKFVDTLCEGVWDFK